MSEKIKFHAWNDDIDDTTSWCDGGEVKAALAEKDDLLDEAVKGLELLTMNDENRERVHLMEKEALVMMIKHLCSVASKILERINKTLQVL